MSDYILRLEKRLYLCSVKQKQNDTEHIQQSHYFSIYYSTLGTE